MNKKNQPNDSRRTFLKLSTLLPLSGLVNSTFVVKPSIYVDDDIVIINGWVLLKSDLIA